MSKKWWEKEGAYQQVYSAGKQAKSISQYIPDAKVEAVAETLIDSDGYWVFLEEGWTAYDGGEDCRTIHEYSIVDLRAAIKTIRKEVRQCQRGN